MTNWIKEMKGCCTGFSDSEIKERDFEVVKIKKTKNVCQMCEDFAKIK